MQNMMRRGFVATTAATSLALASRQLTAANEKVVIGVIGLGGQGRGHLNSYLGIPNVEIAYVCDVDEQRLAEAVKLAPNAKPVNDLRRILDDKSIDAVSIATPDHWHTPASLLALAAGKHVYVEKPCSHNVREGRWLVEAAARSGKLVQHGTQSRSTPFIQAAIKLLRDGIIGDVIIARAWDVQFRPSIGKEMPAIRPAVSIMTIGLAQHQNSLSKRIVITTRGTGGTTLERVTRAMMGYMRSISPAGDWGAKPTLHKLPRSVASTFTMTTNNFLIRWLRPSNIREMAALASAENCSSKCDCGAAITPTGWTTEMSFWEPKVGCC